MIWEYEKFRGDAAIYAFCPKCGFHHCPSRMDYETFKVEIVYQYNYCPVCGEYLYDENFYDGVEVIWDERDILELYNVKVDD